MTAGPITVVIADDQPLVRSGLRLILEGEIDIRIVGEAGDGSAAIAQVATHAPDVLLLDVQMPGVDGLAVLQDLARTGASTRVLMLTTFDLDEYVYRAMRTGAVGFLLKDMQGEDIVSAVRQVARGNDPVLAPAVTRRLVERFTSRRERPPAPALDGLTPRELDVFRLLADGLTNAEISGALFIGETTVKTHVARVLMKLGLRDRVQAAILAHETGMGDGIGQPGEAP